MSLRTSSLALSYARSSKNMLTNSLGGIGNAQEFAGRFVLASFLVAASKNVGALCTNS